MMKNVISLLIFISINTILNAQLYHSNWIFTFENYIKFHHSNQSNTLENLPIIFNNNHIAEGSTTQSDFNGNLLLYTNGEDVYNKYHEKLNSDPLKGFSGSTQSSVIIPYPNHYNQYILITIGGGVGITPDIKPQYWNYNGVNYYIIDLNKNNGHGELIIPNNNQILAHSSQKIAYTKHENEIDYWALTYRENKFYAFLINKNGINPPIISEVPFSFDERGHSPSLKGQLKISPDGNKIAIAHKNIVSPNSFMNYTSDMSDYEGVVEFMADENPGAVLFYHFNKSTGAVTNQKVLFHHFHTQFGVEFSPSSRYVFLTYNTSNSSGIDFYDSELDLMRSAYISIDYDLPFVIKGSLQLGIDGKIYHSQNNLKYLNCIKNPDDIITYPADYITNCQTLENSNTNGIANFPSFYLNESIKLYNSFDEKKACVNTPITFWVNMSKEIESAFWDFGDGSTSIDKAPVHRYTTAGTYIIKAIINGKEYIHHLTIHDPIDLPEFDLKSCIIDNDDEVWFDLNKFNIYLADRIVYISYHSTLHEAEQNINAFENLIIPNTPNFVYARIIGKSGCITITKINLVPDQTQLQQEYNTICADIIENQYVLNLDTIRSLYENQMIKIFFSQNEMMNYENEVLSNIYLENNQPFIKLFIRSISPENCDNYIELKLNLLYPTNLNLENKNLCTYDEFLTYVIPQTPEIREIEWIGLYGNDATQDINHHIINISNPGTYQVKITNQNGCTSTEEFTITRTPELDINIYFSQAGVIAIDYQNYNSESYEFSLDQGLTWNRGTSYTNVAVGNHEIWIREISGNQCIVYKQAILNDKIYNFLSPNGDGINDSWRINGFEKYEWIDVVIYDRYGKELVNKRINYSNEIWDGRYNGQVLPSNSYWYKLSTSQN